MSIEDTPASAASPGRELAKALALIPGLACFAFVVLHRRFLISERASLTKRPL